MKIIAMIPARYAASRFPAKLVQDLAGKPVILRTYEAAMQTGLFSEVYVVTDSTIIYDMILHEGGKAIMSIKEHECGSDRIAEAVEAMDVDIIVNVQGDEPFINTSSLKALLAVFKGDNKKEIDLASPMIRLTNQEEIQNPNVVKVIIDHQNFALYFSRSPIPYHMNTAMSATYYQHKGIYAFRKSALMDFKQLPMQPLEAIEKIEAIRYLEYGKKIKMVETQISGIGIDTPDDLEKARKVWK